MAEIPDPTPALLAEWRRQAEQEWNEPAGLHPARKFSAGVMLALFGKIDAGDRFKAFVHAYLTDPGGVPEDDPENQHSKQGCRIGARLDLIFEELRRLRAMLPDHAGQGDTQAQAKAWSAVWKAMVEVGLLSFVGRLPQSGMERAVGFVRNLAAERDEYRRLREEWQEWGDALVATIEPLEGGAVWSTADVRLFIGQAVAERDALRRQVAGLADRVAAQSELLSRRAEGG